MKVTKESLPYLKKHEEIDSCWHHNDTEKKAQSVRIVRAEFKLERRLELDTYASRIRIRSLFSSSK